MELAERSKVADDVRAFLVAAELAAQSDAITLEALEGGVSSDIWRVHCGDRVICVKRALAQLRVARKWEAPTRRSSFEWAWLETAARIIRGSTPDLYAHDAERGFIAMEYLAPDRYANWKTLLRDGSVSQVTAAMVGDRLGTLHAATADRSDIAAAFASDDIFFALRLKPYLLDCIEVHPTLATELEEIVRVTASTKRVLVHGDVSPKNILVGESGPRFIDAECAWYGDPAFDLAFVLNHLLLKSVWRPAHAREYRAAFWALADAYRARVIWEPVAALEARCARLLPALTLGRIDGTSPVEYLTGERDRATVRAFATACLRAPHMRLSELVRAWEESTS